jgi:hypothetical protein
MKSRRVRIEVGGEGDRVTIYAYRDQLEQLATFVSQAGCMSQVGDPPYWLEELISCIQDLEPE